jgi:predicted ABC-type ATPase
MGKRQLRLRVFAGPNGSGKSTVIETIKSQKVKGKAVDFGIYINADDIASALSTKRGFSFNRYKFIIDKNEFENIALRSGLINTDFPLKKFHDSYAILKNIIHSSRNGNIDRLAQIIADFSRKKLLSLNKRFSFETVFSHHSKLDIMKDAKEAGYKVYLYFVSTESPEINKFRVAARVRKRGHNVDPEKIESRYYKSLDLLHDAAQLAYQAYFFDNSKDDQESTMFAHFKIIDGKKSWDDIDVEKVPEWFRKYYTKKTN